MKKVNHSLFLTLLFLFLFVTTCDAICIEKRLPKPSKTPITYYCDTIQEAIAILEDQELALSFAPVYMPGPSSKSAPYLQISKVNTRDIIPENILIDSLEFLQDKERFSVVALTSTIDGVLWMHKVRKTGTKTVDNRSCLNINLKSTNLTSGYTKYYSIKKDYIVCIINNTAWQINAQ